MPLPMVHLGVAVRLGEMRGSNPSKEFLLGSIAPDAIHTRPDAGRTAKAETHLQMLEEGLVARMGRFLNSQQSLDEQRQRFVTGYVAHILTDVLWNIEIIQPLREQISTTLGKDEWRKLYYQEADQVDFNLYNGAIWRQTVWAQLEQAAAPDLPPLLTAGEISLWQARTLRWFEELKEEPGVEPQHLTDEVVQAFMGRAAIHVASTLDQLNLYDH